MQCKKCGNYINKSSRICPNCKTNYKKYANYSMPKVDKYDNQIYEVETDKNKSEARRMWLHNGILYGKDEKLKEMKHQRFKYVGKRIMHMLLTMLILTIIILSFTFIILMLPSIKIHIKMIVIILFSFLSAGIAIYILLKKDYKKDNYDDIYANFAFEHDEASSYYANNNVFGFTTFNHECSDTDGDSTYYYDVYEFDVNNIVNILYNEQYAEYIIVLSKPVYTSYIKEPTIYFSIPDIFDDYILSNALHCDLPPKNIYF